MNVGEYSPMFTEPEANNCLSIIFRAKQKGLQNNGIKHKNTDAIALFVCINGYSRSFNNKLTCTSQVNQFTHRVRQ